MPRFMLAMSSLEGVVHRKPRYVTLRSVGYHILSLIALKSARSNRGRSSGVAAQRAYVTGKSHEQLLLISLRQAHHTLSSFIKMHTTASRIAKTMPRGRCRRRHAVRGSSTSRSVPYYWYHM